MMLLVHFKDHHIDFNYSFTNVAFSELQSKSTKCTYTRTRKAVRALSDSFVAKAQVMGGCLGVGWVSVGVWIIVDAVVCNHHRFHDRVL